MPSNPVQKMEDLARDEYYSRYNLVDYELRDDTIKQWIKNHFEYLEVHKDSDETLRCIWIDLSSAIASLEEPDRSVVLAYAYGYRDRALVEHTGQTHASAILSRGMTSVVSKVRGNI